MDRHCLRRATDAQALAEWEDAARKARRHWPDTMARLSVTHREIRRRLGERYDRELARAFMETARNHQKDAPEMQAAATAVRALLDARAAHV